MEINRDTLNSLRREAVSGTKKFIRLKDARVKSFFWQATQKGRVIGVLRYNYNGSDKVYEVAEFGSGLNQFTITGVLAKARKVATEIKMGGDPMEQRKLDKIELALTKAKRVDRLAPDDIYVRQKADEYYAQNSSLPSSKLVIRRGLNEIIKAFGHKRIKDVTRDDVVSLILRLQERGSSDCYSVAENCQKQGCAMWSWGLDIGGFGNAINHFAALKRFKKTHSDAAKKTSQKKRMTMKDAKEMAEIHFCKFNEGTRRAILLQAYTAVRPSNATSTTPMKAGGQPLHVDWKEFDLDAGVWSIPQEQMKGRARSHEIILPRQMVAHLKAWHEADGHPESGMVVRCRMKTYKPIIPTALAESYRNMGLRYTPHKWRHLISTYIAERGGAEIADLILAHYTSNSYFAATRKKDRAKWLQVWADKLDTLGFDKLVPDLLQ
jgi:integrase